MHRVASRSLAPLLFLLWAVICPVRSFAQPSPWPSPQHDARHTSRADVDFPDSLPERAWDFRTGDYAVRRAPMETPTDSLVSTTFGLFALTADGRAKWAANLHDPSEAVAGADGTVYVSTLYTYGPLDGALVALTPEGEEKWAYPVHNVPSGPLVGPDGTIYFTSQSRGNESPHPKVKLYALHPDGTPKWVYDSTAEVSDCMRLLSDGGVLMSVNFQDLLLISSSGELKWTRTGQGDPGCSEVGPGDRIPTISYQRISLLGPDGKALWSREAGYNIYHASFSADGDVVTASDRDILIYDMEGKLVRKFSLPVETEIHPNIMDLTLAPVPACPADGACGSGEMILALDHEGTLYAFSEGGDLLWKVHHTSDYYPYFEMLYPPRIKVTPSGQILISRRWLPPHSVEAISLTGEILWDWEPGATITGLAVDGNDRVYASSESVYALNGDGTLRWRFRGPDREARTAGETPTDVHRDLDCTPPILLSNGTLVTRAGDLLYGLDPEDGSVRWRQPLPVPNFIPSVPLPAGPPGGPLPTGGFTGASEESMAVMNDDGTVRWTYRADGAGPYTLASFRPPVAMPDGTLAVGIDYWDRRCYYSSESYEPECPPEAPTPEVRMLGPDGKPVGVYQGPWREGTLGPASAGEDGTLYFGAGDTLYALSGGHLKWTYAGIYPPMDRFWEGWDYTWFTGLDTPPVLRKGGSVMVPARDFRPLSISPDGEASEFGLAYNVRPITDAKGRTLIQDGRLTLLDPEGHTLWSDPTPFPQETQGVTAPGTSGQLYIASGVYVTATAPQDPSGGLALRADMDLDGKVTLIDAVLLLRRIVDPSLVGPTPQGDSPGPRGDVDGDGGVDIQDVVALLRSLVGMEGT